jgi:hypothetical protein
MGSVLRWEEFRDFRFQVLEGIDDKCIISFELSILNSSSSLDIQWRDSFEWNWYHDIVLIKNLNVSSHNISSCILETCSSPFLEFHSDEAIQFQVSAQIFKSNEVEALCFGSTTFTIAANPRPKGDQLFLRMEYFLPNRLKMHMLANSFLVDTKNSDLHHNDIR